MKFRWSLAPPQPAMVAELANALHLSPLLTQCLLNRGVAHKEAVARFLQPRLKELSDPFLLPNMTAAIERLFLARERNEPLVIFGDYDVDGVTSTALLLTVLRALGWRAEHYLPHRMDEGYGLTQEAVENCLRHFPVPLLVAVDCGSGTPRSIAWLRERGVDVPVLAHHQISAPPPPATALINPQLAIRTDRLKRNDLKAGKFTAPTEFCSVGLAFKFAHALVKHGRAAGLPGAADFDLRPLLDLVALGTIADLVPLTGENRILVSAGLERLNTTQRPGLVALKQVSQCPDQLGVYEVGFQLAPRLNAAGRLETAADSLGLLLARDIQEAMPMAQRLNACNRERRVIERRIAEQALTTLRGRFQPETDFVIVEGHSEWHIGVVGIVASRVLQQFYRPTVLVGGEGAEWRGSGRSIAGFDLAAALRECSDLLVRHGGHAMAAGVSVRPEKLDEFRTRLNEVARRTLKAEALQPLLRLDAQVRLEEVTLDCLERLSQFKPTGQGNPAPQFCACSLTHQRPPQRMGADKQHLKMWVADSTGVHEAVWWGAGSQQAPEGTFDLAFTPQVNDYNGRRSVQLKVLDFH